MFLSVSVSYDPLFFNLQMALDFICLILLFLPSFILVPHVTVHPVFHYYLFSFPFLRRTVCPSYFPALYVPFEVLWIAPSLSFT